ncbi:PREDICTED: uncharacterized protein LOC109477974 [Branchiostoma belcheri]|uniref:Uncharacterized protein LOC109477974 n=1 Tax=Branchiostoma belcheri TaxID=7741 RepID=A0A6P4ZVL4_BRABE|nr:PREDICTED: uncharacterized protein LOC109477974 [Branchiostoma belcheri]
MAAAGCLSFALIWTVISYLYIGATAQLTRNKKVEPITAETVVLGPLRLWQLIAIVVTGVSSIVITACCFSKCRIPRTKKEIEARNAKRENPMGYMNQVAMPQQQQQPGAPRPAPPQQQGGVVLQPSALEAAAFEELEMASGGRVP